MGLLMLRNIHGFGGLITVLFEHGEQPFDPLNIVFGHAHLDILSFTAAPGRGPDVEFLPGEPGHVCRHADRSLSIRPAVRFAVRGR